MNYQSGSGKGKLLALLAGFAATCLAGPGHAASFPEYPLQTGTGSIPPNIVFIMDDSGSMGYEFMPSQTWPLEDKISHRSYVNNPMYYDPRVDYKAWMQADGTRKEGGTNYTSAFAHVDLASGPIDLSNKWSCYTSKLNGSNRKFCGGVQTYYVPKEGITSPGTSASNYYRYVITEDQDLERCEYRSSHGGWWDCDDVATAHGRSVEEELTNYATWFSYHRTRMKAAKAGASEAFGQLGENYRVGYDSIWNREGSTGKNSSIPVFPIPVNNNGGKFSGKNRSDWFDFLFDARNSGNTPLHAALQRAGEYYETSTDADGPWGPGEGGEQLSCRQNFAILTTDGHWNEKSGYTEVGNTDGEAGDKIESADGERSFTYAAVRPYTDDRADTLADVAMHYWKRDLREDLANNVPSSPQNPAFWQHMSTFGISIGLKGTLTPEDVILIEQGQKIWTNPNSNTTTARIDDLLHAAVNSRGQFVAASNPQEFAEALKNSLAAISRKRASGSNVASNGPSLNNGSHLFQATYVSGEWSGDVSGISIVGGVIGDMPSWSMAEVANEDPAAFASRPVFTHGNSGGTSFPTNAQLSALKRNEGLPGEVAGAANANYIKGSRTGEGTSPGSLRQRTSPVGDIVNSSPFYVPENGALFIGANDGMLHGINSADGTTLFSYVPRGLDFSKLALLSSQDYTHHFFVDGGIDVTTKAQGGSKNILVASLGRGGKGVFALDVTNPASPSSNMVLWDHTFQSGGDSDMGHVLGAPLVRMGNNDATLAFVGNGIDSVSGKAVLFIYNATTGALVKKIELASGTGNGLAEVRAADIDGDGKADYLYAGDLKGNLWKVDISHHNTNQWEVAHKHGNTTYPMFTAEGPAGNAQPITSAVALAREPATGRIFVVFGTGSYITNGDLTDDRVQSVYALVDEAGTYPIAKSELQQRTIPVAGVDSLGRAARAWEPYSALPDEKRGWYVNLGTPTEGERVVTAPFVRGRALWFSSIIPQPGSGCDSGGTGYLNAVDVFTGTNPSSVDGGTGSFIDVNADGRSNDRLAGSTGEGGGYVTSVDLGIGMPSQGTAVGNLVFVGGSEGGLGKVPVGGGALQPKRLRWHELVGDQ